MRIKAGPLEIIPPTVYQKANPDRLVDLIFNAYSGHPQGLLPQPRSLFL